MTERYENDGMIKIGIVGAGSAVDKFMREAEYADAVSVTGIFNPHKKQSHEMREYADRHNLYYQENDYKEFLKKLNAVYIISSYDTRCKYVRMALENKKHVLCKTPVALTESQAEELFTLADRNGCVLMEAIETVHYPGFKQLIEVAQSGIIGKLRDIEAGLAQPFESVIQEGIPSNYEEAFINLGSYTILPVFKLLGRNYSEIKFYNTNASELYTRVSFVYDEALAMSKTGRNGTMEEQLLIAGTKGYILAKHQWWKMESFEVRFEDPDQKEIYCSEFLGEGLRYEIRDFAGMIHKSDNQALKVTREESIAISGIIEEFRRQFKENRMENY